MSRDLKEDNIMRNDFVSLNYCCWVGEYTIEIAKEWQNKN